MPRARVVIGANFGDEGKGLAVDWLCSQGAGCVVRFNGGANAGHTVVTPSGDRHVFRHFGSGTLQGIPTYLSQFFVCNPILFFQELRQLTALGVTPIVGAHPGCLITTYADMLINQEREDKRGAKRHGSCGIGVHETVERSRVDSLKITLGDVLFGGRIKDRLAEICSRWSSFRIGKEFVDDDALETFYKCLQAFAEYVTPMGIVDAQDPVFEGAQGLLLSQDNKEYAPHLTHSYTGMQNVRTLCAQGNFEPEIYYVSRTYLTRHGAGKLPGEDPKLSYDDDTNQENQWQGPLRFAPLDDGLHTRMSSDSRGLDYKLILTHCDQAAPRIEADFYSHGRQRTAVQTAYQEKT